MLIPDNNITKLITMWNDTHPIKISYDNQLKLSDDIYHISLNNIINNPRYDNEQEFYQSIRFLEDVVTDTNPMNIHISATVSDQGLSHYGQRLSYSIIVKLIAPHIRTERKKRIRPNPIIQVLRRHNHGRRLRK